MRKYSEEQTAAIDEIVMGKEHTAINSVAGSGKTTVIVEGARRIPRNVSALVLAFNKSIATELEERLRGSGVKSGTFHSVCNQFLQTRLNRVKIDKDKCYKILNKACPEFEPAKTEIVRLVGLMKNLGVGILLPNTEELVSEIRDNYDIASEDVCPKDLVLAARTVFKKSNMDIAVIDFDDMIYLTLKFVVEKGWQMDRYDVVIVDEFQDMSEVQLAILESMAHRIVGVGDDNQAIYGFRGAGVNSIARAVGRWGMVEKDMSITWRCPVKVVEYAQQWVPKLKARDGAPDGVLEWKTFEEGYQLLRPNDCMMVCRNNFPLFQVALKLLVEQKSFKMTGNYPYRLIGFVNSFRAKDIKTFRERLREWFDDIKAKLEEKKKFGQLEREQDKFDCLWLLQQNSTTVDELKATLQQMMNSRFGPVLTTIHGAKGLEAERVIVLAPELMPSKYAVTDEQLAQETNLMYVAATRSKLELYYVEGKNDRT